MKTPFNTNVLHDVATIPKLLACSVGWRDGKGCVTSYLRKVRSRKVYGRWNDKLEKYIEEP